MTVVYHTLTDRITLARNCVFLELDGSLYDASSGSKMRRWFLLNILASVRSDSTPYMQLITVLLRGIYRRYAIHKLCSTLFDVYKVMLTIFCNVKEDDTKTNSLGKYSFKNLISDFSSFRGKAGQNTSAADKKKRPSIWA